MRIRRRPRSLADYEKKKSTGSPEKSASVDTEEENPGCTFC
jgi:hypothetical protein